MGSPAVDLPLSACNPQAVGPRTSLGAPDAGCGVQSLGADVFLEQPPRAAGYAEPRQDGRSWAALCRFTLAVIKSKMLFMLFPLHTSSFILCSFISIMWQVPT